MYKKIFVSSFFLLFLPKIYSQCVNVVSNTNDNGSGSLRQAIINSNACLGAPTISFSISSTSTIVLLSDLPSITVSNLLIDGTSASGFSYPSSMVTILWDGEDDCFQQNSGNNNIIRGLTFTENFLGNGDAAIRVNGGNNLLVNRCRAYNQRKNLVRVQGGANVRVIQCSANNFDNNGSAKVFEVNSGSLVDISFCSISNIPRKVYEINGSANGGSLGKISIYNNTITNVGYEDGSSGTKGSHIFSSYTNHGALFSVRNNSVNTSPSKLVEFINTSGIIANRDSIYNNIVTNIKGQHTIYIESNSGVYGGVTIRNNLLTGTGINLDAIDQVIEIGGWGNNYSGAVITTNTITNYHGRAIMCRYSDNMTIHENLIYNCSKDACIEINDDCDNVTITGNILGTNSLNAPGLSIFTGNTIDLNDCDNCTVGGDRSLNLGNVIIASTNGGGRKAINVSSQCQNTTLIRGNCINVSSDGLNCLSNSNNSAVQIDGPSLTNIGGDSLIYRNFICGGSGGKGIEFKSANGIIEGNLIGCRTNGCAITTNSLQYGILLNSNANNISIGNVNNPNRRNKIGYCQEAIRNDNMDNVQWSGNEFWKNTALVPVKNNGGSPNNNILPPVISSVTLPFTVQGTGLGGRVELYLWDSGQPQQGFKYLGFTSGATWTFTSLIPISNDIVAIQFSGMDASEFSGFDVPLQGPLAPLNCSCAITSPTILATSNTICIGQTATLTALGALTYTWINSGANSSTLSINPNVSTTYSLIAASNASNCISSAAFQVTVYPLPTLTLTSSTPSVCSGGSIVLTAIGAQSYTWTGGILNGTPFQPSVTSSYSATGTSSVGCVNILPATFQVTVYPLPTLTLTSSSPSVCSGGSIALSAIGAQSYTWTGGIFNGIPFQPTTTSSYSAIGTSSVGCENLLPATLQVTVYPLPTLTLTASSPSVCSGGSVVLTAIGAQSYTWTGGIFNGTSFQPSVTSSYSVVGTSSAGCVNNLPTTFIVSVKPLPTIITMASNTMVCRGQTFTLSASGANTFSWNTGVTMPSFTTSSTFIGNTNYTVTGIDASGCKNSAVITIKVNSCLGIMEFEDSDILIYPNPSNGIINLNISKIGLFELEMVNLLGQTVFSQFIQGFDRIDISGLNSGVYILRLNYNKQIVYRKHIIRD